MRKVGSLTLTDPRTGEELTDMVEDDFKLPKELKPFAKLEWKWMPEVWEGTRIEVGSVEEDAIVINVKPCENQHISLDNPSNVKLPYASMVLHSNLLHYECN